MRRIANFLWTTILGGVLVVVPVAVSTVLVVHALAAVTALLQPITSELPADVALPSIIALVIVVVVCFIAGVVVRTGPGRWAQDALERYLLDRIPGYTLVRGLTGRITGQEAGTTFAVAMVEIEEALVPAFIVEEHDDGRYTVFVPSVPTPAAGTVYVLTPERVHLVDVPLTKAVSVISKWGAGSRDLVAAMQPPKV